ncbi:hypothetical protein D3C77_178320 [compost metagenome]
MAFWKLGKKEPKKDTNKVAIDTGAFLIDLQLKRAGQLPGFDEIFHSPFVRGYFVGVFSGAMQAFQIPGYGDHTKTLAFLVGGHIALIGEKHGFQFVMDSVSLQGNRDYDLGNRLGGQELVDFLNKKVTMPTQLYNYFKGN